MTGIDVSKEYPSTSTASNRPPRNVWAGAIGAGVGLLTGVFEARAIDRELTAERGRLRNRQLEAENDRLDDFATILSHDLRNPLNVASGSVELASKTSDSLHLENAETALSRMDEIIEETLVLARSGQVIGETEPVDLGVLALSCWQNVDTACATIDVDDPKRLGRYGPRAPPSGEPLPE